jgi:cysteine desulfurase
MDSIYLDNNATTRPSIPVMQAVSEVMRECWANPSGTYPAAKAAGAVLQEARNRVARFLQATPAEEVVFTSGGTESIQSAIFGVMAMRSGGHIISTAVEHTATLQALERLKKKGCQVTLLSVDKEGQMSLDELEAAIQPNTTLISVMHANNETGVLFPVEAISDLCRKRRILFHIDAVQAAGKIETKAPLCDLMSISGHKIHGPKGIGALYIRRYLRWDPLLPGGRQEAGRRAGTENVSGIGGLGVAAESARLSLETGKWQTVKELRDQMERAILKTIPDATINGVEAPRLPNTTSLTIPGINAKQFVADLGQDGICMSNGPACSSGSSVPSHVLVAMGLLPSQAMSSIRISLSCENTPGELDRFIEVLAKKVNRARATSAVIA